MISLSLAVAMAMTAAPVTALAVDETVLTTAQNAGETETETETTTEKDVLKSNDAETLTGTDDLDTTSDKTVEVESEDALHEAIKNANDGDRILITAGFKLTKPVIIDKGITVEVDFGYVLTVDPNGNFNEMGDNHVFRLSHKDAVLDNVTLSLEDNHQQLNIVYVSAGTVQNCRLDGSGAIDNPVTRGVMVESGARDVVIKNNVFNEFFASAYINGGAEGEITNNESMNTAEGWCIVNSSDMEFSNNTFSGTNGVEMKLFDENPVGTSNYDVIEMSNDNPGVSIQDEVKMITAQDGCLVVDANNAFATLDKALEAAEDGDTIKLLSDITVTSTGPKNNAPGINITKAITLDGNGNTIRPDGAFTNENSLIGVTGVEGNSNTPVVIKNLILDGTSAANVKHALNLYESTGVVIDNVTGKNVIGYGLVVNSAEATVKSMDVSDCTWGAVNVDTRTDENSKLVIEDGTFSGLNSVFVEHSKEITDGGEETGESSVVINGGTFQAPVASNAEDAAFDISGGNFQAATGGKGTSFNVTGGTFAQDFTVDTDNLAINGGTFNGNVANNKEGATNTITGGNFANPPSVLPEYMEVVNNKVVVKTDAGCLEKAIENAKDGDTLHLQAGTYTLADNVCMILDKKLTISGEGSETIIKGSSSVDYGNGLFTFTAGSEGSVLENMTIKYTATGAQTSAVYFNGNFAGTEANPTTIRNVDFQGSDSLETIGKEMAITSTYLPNDKGSLHISDCSFKNFAYAMYFNNISDLTVEGCVIDGTKYNAINIAADSDSYESKDITLTGNTLTNISYANYEDDAYSSGIRLGENISDDPVVTDNNITMLNNKKPILVEESTPGTAKYVVLYKDGNTVIGQIIVDAGESITLPTAPSKSGYNFKGWNDGTTTYDAEEKIENIQKDMTFTAQWSRKSSGSSHSYDGYITIINPKNGEVSVSDDWAYEDDKITLTVTPDKGYEVDKIEIVDDEGDKITAKKVEDEDNKYTFRMANCDVTVTVTFKEEGKTTEDTDKEEDKDDEETTELNFTDVKESDWFYKGVAYVVDKGVMSGVSENEFAPSGKLTRAMLVQMLYNMESRPACDAENAFIDVPVGQWYTDAVIWANDEKIVSGMGDGLFAPNMEITREQMVVMLYNYAKYKGYDVTASADLSKFADNASVSTWAQPAMQWAVAEGYISGMGDNQLAPHGTATRAEIASVIMRFMEATAESAETAE